MIALKNVSIPQTCHQSWQQMENAEDGRHCTHCAKTVIDFTEMSNDEIVTYLSATTGVCGRFNHPQLITINHQNDQEGLPAANAWKKWAIAIGLIGSTAFFKAGAQATSPVHPTEQGESARSPQRQILLGKVYVPDSAKLKIITGRVIDQTNSPIPGATVEIPQGNAGTVSDSNGYFSMRVSPAAKQFRARCIGCVSRVIDIGADPKKTYEVKLADLVMGEVVIVKQPFFKSVYYKFIKRPLRQLFR